nr:odorant receptor 18 [Psyttalia incisi]
MFTLLSFGWCPWALITQLLSFFIPQINRFSLCPTLRSDDRSMDRCQSLYRRSKRNFTLQSLVSLRQIHCHRLLELISPSDHRTCLRRVSQYCLRYSDIRNDNAELLAIRHSPASLPPPAEVTPDDSKEYPAVGEGSHRKMCEASSPDTQVESSPISPFYFLIICLFNYSITCSV